MTMFNALLFSEPLIDFFLKSFDKEVPMPKAPIYNSNQYSRRTKQTGAQRTFETELITMLLQLQRLVHVQRIGVYNHLFCVIHPKLLVYLLCAGCKNEWVPRVLAQTYPMLSEVLVGEKVLRRQHQLRSSPHYRVRDHTL